MTPPRPDRRSFLLAGFGLLLGGCATTSQQSSRRLPGPPWDMLADSDSPSLLPHQPGVTGPPLPAGARPRASWAGGPVIPSRLSRMTKIKAITVHHDGTYFDGRTDRDTAARIEGHRRYHLTRQPAYGDIGYHFLVDRRGVVWEGRPIAWQGAHAGRTNNPGNIGIAMMGNFEQQRPAPAQLSSLARLIRDLHQRYPATVGKVYTHRELPNTSTICPGRFLQPLVDQQRRSRVYA